MSKHLLLADVSTAFAYLSLFYFKDPAEPKRVFKKRELIFSIRGKAVLRDSAGQSSSLDISKANTWGDDWFMNLIQNLLEEEKIKKTDYLALGRGPGRFTSLRIAHITFRMLSLLWEAPTIHFSSMPFWHSFFGLKQDDTLLIRANRNLYYIYAPNRDPSFAAMTWSGWLDFARKNHFPRAFLWASTWSSHSAFHSASRKNEKNIRKDENDFLQDPLNDIPNEMNIKIQELNLTAQIERNKTNQEFIYGFMNFSEIEKMAVPLEKFLPEYGHQVSFKQKY